MKFIICPQSVAGKFRMYFVIYVRSGWISTPATLLAAAAATAAVPSATIWAIMQHEFRDRENPCATSCHISPVIIIISKPELPYGIGSNARQAFGHQAVGVRMLALRVR
jgi:hypothetical protein